MIEDAKIVEVGPNSARKFQRACTSTSKGIDGHAGPDRLPLPRHAKHIEPGGASVESPFYAASKAFEIMKGMLHRGFTTVRDVGGADWGIARARSPRAASRARALFMAARR